MRTLSLSIFSIFSGFALAQAPSDLFDKAPPAIDDALRARVQAFYQSHVDGKFRQADNYVAEDSKDAFFVAEKPQYKSFQISKINYEENYTKATVVTACKTEMFFHGKMMPVTMPNVSHWKVQDGEWFWYYTKPSQMETPFGTMKTGPENNNPGFGFSIPQDPRAEAIKILKRVTLDRSEVSIDQDQNSKAEIHLKNGLLGPVTVTADPTGTPGLTVRPAKPEVGPNEEIAVLIEFNFEDPSINCRQCLVNPGARPPATVNLHVQPANLEFPIKINFTQHGVGK